MYEQRRFPRLAWVSIAAGVLWFWIAADHGLLTIVLTLPAGGLLLAAGIAHLLWPGDVRITQTMALGGLLAVLGGLPMMFVAGAASADVEHAMHGLNLGAIVVHLSPIFDPLDRDVASAIAFRPPRPALMVVSEEDVYAVQSVNAMRAARPGDPVTVQTVRSSGHGVTILHKPENFAAIAAWLSEQFPSSR